MMDRRGELVDVPVVDRLLARGWVGVSCKMVEIIGLSSRLRTGWPSMAF